MSKVTLLQDGPAFPFESQTTIYPGMMLRDYFAAKAMAAAFAGPGARMIADRDDRYDETNWAQVVAANAYEMADAMLAHRAQDTADA
ncbi:hypothetical protein [Sphingobium yanoikuyae]|uniref:hypothetical protein n=1 Tax=Sphingobium yanoikuyae TaxID=13690 RepID=UPI00242A83CE|nr:hypothetical protein [Sphingobium yanoikuyae]